MTAEKLTGKSIDSGPEKHNKWWDRFHSKEKKSINQ